MHIRLHSKLIHPLYKSYELCLFWPLEICHKLEIKVLMLVYLTIQNGCPALPLSHSLYLNISRFLSHRIYLLSFLCPRLLVTWHNSWTNTIEWYIHRLDFSQRRNLLPQSNICMVIWMNIIWFFHSKSICKYLLIPEALRLIVFIDIKRMFFLWSESSCNEQSQISPVNIYIR